MLTDKKIYPNVKLGRNVIIGDFVIIGVPPSGKKDGELPLVIGDNAVIRSFTIIYAGSKIGDNFQTGHYALVRENNDIGDNVAVGTGTELGPGNLISDEVKIHSGCFMELARLGRGCALGPNTIFLDDLHPRCPKWEKCVGGVQLGENVSVGGNVTILPGIKISDTVLIGAGSVVTKDIPADSVVAGNPARIIKKVSELKCVKNYFKYPYAWREGSR